MKATPSIDIDMKQVGEVVEVEAMETGAHDAAFKVKRLAAQYMAWSDAAEFKADCQEYFEKCDEAYRIAMDDWNRNQMRSEFKSKLPLPAPTAYTHIGLCLHLGLLRRSDLSIVGGRSEEFLRVQAWVNAKIEEQMTQAVLQNSRHGLSKDGALILLKHCLPWNAAAGAEDTREEQQQIKVAESSRPQIAIISSPEAARALVEAQKEARKQLGR